MTAGSLFVLSDHFNKVILIGKSFPYHSSCPILKAIRSYFMVASVWLPKELFRAVDKLRVC